MPINFVPMMEVKKTQICLVQCINLLIEMHFCIMLLTMSLLLSLYTHGFPKVNAHCSNYACETPNSNKSYLCQIHQDQCRQKRYRENNHNHHNNLFNI